MALTFYENYFFRKIKFLVVLKINLAHCLNFVITNDASLYMSDASNAVDQSLKVSTIFVDFESTDALIIIKIDTHMKLI